MKNQVVNPLKWVPSLYFAMGLPFVVLNMVSVVMFKDLGVSDARIAFWTSLIMWPWTIKFLWSPFLEIFRTKKFFVVATQLISGVFFGLAALALHLPSFFAIGIALFAVVAFSGATHDIAADGIYMEALDEKDQAKYIGWQGAFYNLAKLVATGGLVWLAGWLYGRFAGENPQMQASFDAYVQSWTIIFFVLGIVLVLLGLYHSRRLPSPAVEHKKEASLREGLNGLKEVITDFFTKKHIWFYIAFIILYRLGEGFVMKIVPLFLKADVESGGLALSNQQIGLYYGTFGAGAFLLGSLLAGYYIAHFGLKRTLFTLCCIFNIPFVVYALLAMFQPSSMWLIGGSIVLEYFGYGFGFVGLTLFMMQEVAPGKHQMAHYAFASGIMNLSVMVTGAVSGYLSDALGYADFFMTVMLFTIPAFIVTWLVPFKKSEGAKNLCVLIVAGVMALSAVSCSTDKDEPVLIPAPQEVTETEGSLNIKNELNLYADCSPEIAERLTAFLSTTDIRFKTVGEPASEKFLNLMISSDVSIPASEEGYLLTVTDKGVEIKALTETGLFYGIQSFAQLYAVNGKTIKTQRIKDYPRFAYRGLMLDVSRNFNTKEFVIRQMQVMASLKLNRLHLHLTDAAGWRLEIDRYPELTDIAAWRIGKTWQNWQDEGKKYAHEGDANASGGYYTKDDIREILAEAARLHITVIPEIELPGHSDEVLAVYPELSCSGEPNKNGEFCIGNEKTFEFLENVLTEVIDLFPSEYIHIGGDEAGKGAWKVCPKCRKRMKQEGLKSVDELQSYTIKRIERFLIAHNRRLLGWDEILEGGLAPEATVMSWRGEDGGRAAAAQGHEVIMTPGAYCYFDAYQDDPESEPQAMSGYLPLNKVYAYDPAPQEMEGREFVQGVQANLWTEFVPTPEHTEYMLYPRLFALAEVAWTAPEKKDYEDFYRRALTLCNRVREMGYNAFDLNKETGERPQSLRKEEHLAVGCPVKYNCKWHSKYPADEAATLTDGLHGSWNYSTRWQGFLSHDFEVEIDLEERKAVKEVSADFIQWHSAWIWLPKEVIVALSDDGENFREVGRIGHETPTTERRPMYRNFAWKGTDTARYIRYTALINPEVGSWLFTDEISVH